MGHFRKQQVTVFPTNHCNMKCTYCVANTPFSHDNPQKIDSRFAKRGIADYFADGTKHQLRFYSGGEPTQAMDIISECWEYAHSIVGDRLITEIQTNAYFDKNVADWLSHHISIIWVSLDGWPEVQNKYRPVIGDPDPGQLILRNLKYLVNHTFVGIRCTIVPETVNRQIDLLRYFNSLGIKHVASEPVFAPVLNSQQDTPGRITGVDLESYIINFAEAWYEAEKMGIQYMNSFIVNFDERVEHACRACLPTPHLTTDGYVSSCDLGFNGNTPLKDLIYGKYDSINDKIVYWPDAIAKLQSRKCVNIAACHDCPVKDICGGGCLGRAYHQTREFYDVIPEYCWASRYLAEHLPIDRIKFDYLHP